MEVLIRAGLAQVGLNMNGGIVPVDTLRSAVHLFEGAPCYVNHSVKGMPNAGRIRLGYWRRVRYDEELELVIGHLHTSLWDPVFERMGFSWHARTEPRQYRDFEVFIEFTKVHSVDLVPVPAQQRCRVLEVIILDESPMKNHQVFVSLFSQG